MAPDTYGDVAVQADVAMSDVSTATFDVDESVAAVVSSHVMSTRDLLALACVSRVLRKVAASEGSWGTCDLEISAADGNLEKLTNDRLEHLLGYCGVVRNLEIRGAPATFRAKCLYKPTLAAKKFAKLETLKIKNCTRVSGLTIACFLQAIGMCDRPKDKRLRCLRLEECDVDHNDVGHFHEYLSFDPSENFDEEKCSFNICKCSKCGDVKDTSKASICIVCKKTFSEGEWANERGDTLCESCNAFVCVACEDTAASYVCDRCEQSVACERCVMTGILPKCEGSKHKPGCFDRWCEHCQDNNGSILICDVCACSWCEACDHVRVCATCSKNECGACAEKAGRTYFHCEYCGAERCSDCDEYGLVEWDCKSYGKVMSCHDCINRGSEVTGLVPCE